MIRRSKKGISIIECLISLIILAILLTAGMSFYFLSHESIRGSIRKKIAVGLANSVLESIKNETYDNLPNPAPAPLGVPYPKYVAPEVEIGGVKGRQDTTVIDVDYDGGGADYKEVRVTITWTEPGKTNANSIILATFKAPSS